MKLPEYHACDNCHTTSCILRYAKEIYERTTAYAQMAEKDDELIGKWCGCIMMVCAAAYQLYLEYLEC